MQVQLRSASVQILSIDLSHHQWPRPANCLQRTCTCASARASGVRPLSSEGRRTVAWSAAARRHRHRRLGAHSASGGGGSGSGGTAARCSSASQFGSSTPAAAAVSTSTTTTAAVAAISVAAEPAEAATSSSSSSPTSSSSSSSFSSSTSFFLPPLSSPSTVPFSLTSLPLLSVSQSPSSSSPAGFLSRATAYDMEVAEQAVQLSCWLTQRVQASLRRKEDSAQAKVDKSLVTIADYGVQAVVSWVLTQAYPGETISLIAEEEAKDLKGAVGVEMLQRLVKVVNECLRRAPLVGLRAPPHALTAVEIITAITRGSSSGGATGRHWILDPVDGTLGFVRQDQYAVALALLDEGRLELGVLGCPNFPVRSSWLRYPHRLHRLTEKLFPSESGWTRGFVLSARRGHGAFMEPLVYKDHDLPADDADTAGQVGTPAAAAATAAAAAAATAKGSGSQSGNGATSAAPATAGEQHKQEAAAIRRAVGRLRARVRVSDVKDPTAAVFCEPVEKANSNHGLTGKLADTLGMRSEALRMYSMAKYAAIARGDAEIFMKFAKASYREKVWDHAAGVVIVEEAGGVVTDAGGKPLDFSKGRFLDGLDCGIIASSGKELHRLLLKALARSWAASHL